MDNPIVATLLEKLSRICETKQVSFCWVPSHVGISGNERADKAAKAALSGDVLPFKVPYTDFKPDIHNCIKTSWQNSWNNDVNNKLHVIKPTLGEWLPVYRDIRREEVVITRLRIGHTRLTHSYLLNKEIAPECIPCYAPLSVAHIFVQCVDVAPIRDKYFNVNDMKELFDKVPVDVIINFLKEVNLYMKL